MNNLLITDSLNQGRLKLNENFDNIEAGIGVGVPDGSITMPKFGPGIRPPRVVISLPALPNAEYTEGDLIVYDESLYQLLDGAWVKVVSRISTEDILEGAIDIGLFADGIRPPRTLTSLPALPNADYEDGDLAVFNNKLYRVNGSVWVPVVNAGDIDGQITETQISDDAISAPKIQANAITADKIEANAVTAAKILAGSVTADKIDANAVTADKINANAVTTAKLNALAVTADKIAANAVTADKITANAITAAKIEAGAVTADKLAANSVTASAILAGSVTADKIQASSIDLFRSANKNFDNLIQNPSMIGGSLDYWRLNSSPGTTFIANTTVTRTGGYALRLDRNGVINSSETSRIVASEEASIDRNVACSQGDSFYLEAWIRRGTTVRSGGVNANNEFRLRFSFRDINNNLLSVTDSYRSLGTTFTRYGFSGTAPANAVYVEFEIEVRGDGRYVYIDDVYARKVVTAGLIRVDGEIEITNSVQNGALSVKNSSNSEVLRLGNIAGKPSVPVGTSYGLWGVLGTGVFIEGVATVKLGGAFMVDFGLRTIAAGSGWDTGVTLFSGPVILSSFTVPVGKEWFAVESINTWNMNLFTPAAAKYKLVVNSVSASVYATRVGGGLYFSKWPAGTYTNLRGQASISIGNLHTASATLDTPNVVGRFMIVEVDEGTILGNL